MSANGTTAPVSRGYTLNALGQRTRVDLSDGGYWLYGYNAKGEVMSGIRHDNTGTPIANQSFGYNFDDIGNRNVATIGSDTTTYTANRLNQYTRIATASGTTTLQHDADGNLLNDGTWTYTWDGEPSREGSGAVDWPKASPKGDRAAGSSRSQHRLINATSGTTSVSFVYDSQSRRIAKTTAAGTIRFIYDDWTTGAGDGSGEITAGGDPLGDMSGREGVNCKLVAEIDNTNSPIRRHLWGLDLSGSPQGAGGVGGLIAMSLASGGAHFMAFDGNGNVFATINAADGTHSARFEYDPFGGTTSATGAAVPLLPFRFSTKYQDTETGLYYYGYRYYSPTFGRSISRDLIEEEGGAGLLCLLGNRAVLLIDPLGLKWLSSNYRGNEFWHGYEVAIMGDGAGGWGRILGRFRGGTGLMKSVRLIPPKLKMDKEGSCCVEDNTGIWDVEWEWWGVKPGKPAPGSSQNPPGTIILRGDVVITPSIADDFTWHEATELKLLEKLFNNTVAIAEKRAKEYWCSGGKRASDKLKLANYIKWDIASNAYLAEARSGSNFDKRFGSEYKPDGSVGLKTPRSQYNESDFDQWYAPKIWE